MSLINHTPEHGSSISIMTTIISVSSRRPYADEAAYSVRVMHNCKPADQKKGKHQHQCMYKRRNALVTQVCKSILSPFFMAARIILYSPHTVESNTTAKSAYITPRVGIHADGRIFSAS